MSASLPRIVIVGLGPGDPDARTVGVQRALDSADSIILRTRIHPGLDDLMHDPRVSDCDDLYERAVGFDELYAAIADRILERAAEGLTVVFAVPGHPRFAERSVPLIESGARERGISVAVHEAVSFLDASMSALAFDPVAQSVQIVDAEHLAASLDRDPFAAGELSVDPSRLLLVAQLYNEKIAAAVKIALSRIYPEEHSALLVRAAGIDSDEAVDTIPLYGLDRQCVNHLTSLVVPPLPPLAAMRAPETLTRIVARLRAPGGCPWDREQTHESLRDSVLEEAYEVVDAIDATDKEALSEELGDLLLLISMHAQIAEEAGDFRVEDVYEGINRKLIRRHPHVFGDASAETPDAVIATWENVKASERAAKGDALRDLGPVDRLPRAMPAMRKAIEILAPRAQLTAPEDPGAGDALRAAIAALIGNGIDPERALEASLRRMGPNASNLDAIASA